MLVQSFSDDRGTHMRMTRIAALAVAVTLAGAVGGSDSICRSEERSGGISVPSTATGGRT